MHIHPLIFGTALATTVVGCVATGGWQIGRHNRDALGLALICAGFALYFGGITFAFAYIEF